MSPRGAAVYVGLGSNLEGPLAQVNQALTELAALPRTTLVRASSWYRSEPLGPGPQPDYINGAALLETALAPRELLLELQHIEDLHDRQRTLRWGPRTLDLDILIFDELTLSAPDLVIPHPRLSQRNFVLYPLAELAPQLVLPGGVRVADLLANVSSQGIVRLADG